MRPSVIFIVGPTAVGKTEAALALAKKLNAEIVSCDSMQIYKGMDIITSKPSPSLTKRVPHYLIDIISSEKEYNVSRFYSDADRKIKYIIARGKVPLVVGGSGLYMSILLDGIFKASAGSEKVRIRLYKLAEKNGSQYLHKLLEKKDPLAASKIHPNDTKRIARALEVIQLTGRRISKLQQKRKGLAGKYAIKIFCLDLARDKLYERIDERVERMFKAGITAEVRKLLELKLSRTASYAIGIRELKGYFQGEYDLQEAKRLIKRNTRQYAKRQLTWFRKDKRISWVKIRAREKPVNIANRIISLVKQ